MRTTVRLDPDLLHEVKLAAAEDRTTMTALMEQALRELLARRRQHRPHPRVPLRTYPGWDLRPGIDLNNSAALLDLMESRDAPA